MFVNKRELVALIKEAVHGGKDYPTTILQMKKEIAELKLQRTMEEREIKHLVKLKEEKLEVENQKKVLASEKQYQEKEMKLQTEYHDKIMKQIDVARNEMKEVYTAIMERLPNLNAEMKIRR